VRCVEVFGFAARVASVVAFAAGCSSSDPHTGQSGGSSGGAGASSQGGTSGISDTVDCEGTQRRVAADELRVAALAADEEALFFTVLTDSDRPIGSVRRLDRRSDAISTVSDVEHPTGLALTAENIIWSVERPGYLGVFPRSGGILRRVNYGRAPYALSALGDGAYFSYQDAMPALFRLDDGMEAPSLLVEGDVQPIYVLPSERDVLFFDASSLELRAHSATEGSSTVATFGEIPVAITADEDAVVWWEGYDLIWLDRESGDRLTLAAEETSPGALKLHGGRVFWISGSQVRHLSSGDESPSQLLNCTTSVSALTFVGDAAFIAAGKAIFEVELP
jgi:hypothetical protein